MTDDTIKRLLPLVAWLGLAAGIFFIGYAGYSVVVGKVGVGSRAGGTAMIPMSSGWPFIRWVLFFGATGAAMVLGAKTVIDESRKRH